MEVSSISSTEASLDFAALSLADLQRGFLTEAVGKDVFLGGAVEKKVYLGTFGPSFESNVEGLTEDPASFFEGNGENFFGGGGGGDGEGEWEGEGEEGGEGEEEASDISRDALVRAAS